VDSCVWPDQQKSQGGCEGEAVSIDRFLSARFWRVLPLASSGRVATLMTQAAGDQAALEWRYNWAMHDLRKPVQQHLPRGIGYSLVRCLKGKVLLLIDSVAVFKSFIGRRNDKGRWRNRTPTVEAIPWFSRPVADHLAAPSIRLTDGACSRSVAAGVTR
jgi:hypothetical protein